MARIDDAVVATLRSLPRKPSESDPQAQKKAYSEKLSAAIAVTFGRELRLRGMPEALPSDTSGAERRVAGGIGAKKVDVTWATGESGLLFGVSIKSINFRDATTKNYQKNLTNRRGDMLIEAVTLHRRFPYSVLAGFFFLDKGAAEDNVGKRRKSTFENAHTRLRLFSGRSDPAGRDEQFERMYLLLLEASPFTAHVHPVEVGKPDRVLSIGEIFDELVRTVAERNPDFYEYVDRDEAGERVDGHLVRAAG